MKLKKIPTNIPPPLRKPNKAKQNKTKQNNTPPMYTLKNPLKDFASKTPLAFFSFFSSNKALSVILCLVLATVVEKTYEPVVENAEYSNENYDNLFIAEKVYS